MARLSLTSLSSRTWTKAELDKVIAAPQQLFTPFELKVFQNFTSSRNGFKTGEPKLCNSQPVCQRWYENVETQVVSQLEGLAPTSLAESWDNVGLLIEPSGSKEVGKSVNIMCNDSSSGQESLADK